MAISNAQPAVEKKAPDHRSASIWRLALKRAKPIVLLNDGESVFPLYCIHPVSGDVVGLRDLAGLLHTQRFYGIQVPADRMNRAFGASIEAMARHYIDLIATHQPEGPVALAGWSAGAIIALEMAQQLRRQGREVPVLVALDGAPCNTGAGMGVWNPLYLLKLLLNLPRWIRDDRQQDWSLRGVAKRLESKLAYRFGIGASKISGQDTLDAETMKNVLSAGGWSSDQKAFMYAMHKAMVDYRPAVYDGRALVYETQTQPLYHLRQIGAAWKKIAPATEVVSIKGNHSGLVEQPSIGVIARHLCMRLAEIGLERKLGVVGSVGQADRA